VNAGVHNLLQLLPDMLLSFWFFRSVDRHSRPSAGRGAAALLSLFALFPLYLTGDIFGATLPYTVRFLWRTLCYMAFLALWYSLNWRRCVYLSLFGCACWTACQNILFTPLLYPIVRGELWPSLSPVPREVIFTLLRMVLMTLPLAAVSLLVPFHSFVDPGISQWGVLCVVVLCTVYVKDTLNLITKTPGSHGLESSLFPIFLQLFLMAFLAFFERSLASAKKQEEIRVQEIVNHYRLRNMENKIAGDTDLRQLHHDMKNHLLAIRTLADKEGSSQAVDNYIGSLLNGLQGYESIVETGNSLLNGLMAQKLSEAKLAQTAMDLIINFQKIDFIEDMDLCTIFGNAVDNALEACGRIPRSQDRQIIIRTQESAGQLLITVGNTYQGDIRLTDGLPRTSKNDPNSHGIGLRNISRVLKKYDGALDINLDQPGWFRLIMLLSIPQ